MSEISSGRLIAMFFAIADAMAEEKDRLCELDGVIGDEDHGIAMDLGFSAVARALDVLDADTADPATVFNTAARAFLNAAGPPTGPLYTTAFMRAGTISAGKPTLIEDDFAQAFVAMAKGIQDRGKAEPGDKTMLDAWLPATTAFETARAHGGSLTDSLFEALKAAEAGAEATKAMMSAEARTLNFAEGGLGHMDPGAASAVVLIRTIAKALA